jgi:iron-sulfur cluster assembly protein
MTTATEQPAQAPTAPAKGIQVTEKALAKVRSAMAKEGISPEQGGLRLGVQGGGCSGLSHANATASSNTATCASSSIRSRLSTCTA